MRGWMGCGSAGLWAGGLPQCPCVGKCRSCAARTFETARVVLVRIRLLAALVVGVTRIPSSIELRSVLADRLRHLNELRNFSLSKCSRAIRRMESCGCMHTVRYDDGSANVAIAAPRWKKLRVFVVTVPPQRAPQSDTGATKPANGLCARPHACARATTARSRNRTPPPACRSAAQSPRRSPMPMQPMQQPCPMQKTRATPR